MKIALVGMATGGEDAPFFDPEWECWGMLKDQIARPRCKALYEMHDRDFNQKLGRLKVAEDVDVPIYWQYPDEGPFRQYPLKDVQAAVGGDWFESMIAYMLGHAILMKPDMIGLWGIHMADDFEYFYQRPNLSWMLGVAEGKGIDIHLPEGCRLLSYMGREHKPQYPTRYGYLE